MKFRQQVQTSATKLLGKSGQGYGTVAAHPDIPRAVREYTDNLGITHIEGEAKASYCFAREEGWILLNRTIVASPDQTGRSNHVAHTLAAPESEVQTWLDEQQGKGEALWSPATLMFQFEVAGIWREAWKEDARELGEADLIAVPTIMDGAWLPDVWKGHPEKGLAALTTDSQLKILKWSWEGIDEGIDQLRCYAHAFSAMDPDQGKKRPQPEIDRLFPENLRCSWGWTFATVLLDSQKPDDFKWFGISKARNKGNTSPREEFFPSHAAVPTDDPRADYIKNKEEAIWRMNQETYNAAVIKLKGLLVKWRTILGRRFPNKLPDAEDFLSEVDTIIKQSRVWRKDTEDEQRKLNELKKSLGAVEEAFKENRSNARDWLDLGEISLTKCEECRKPTALDLVRQEFTRASELVNDPTAGDVESEYLRLESNSRSLESKIGELRNEVNHLRQLLKPDQSVKRNVSFGSTAALPEPSTVASKQLNYQDLGTQDSLPRPTELRAQTTEERNPGSKPKKTKRKTNAIWAWILGMTFVALIGVIGWKLGDNLGYKRGKGAHDNAPAIQYNEGFEAGRKAGRFEVNAEDPPNTINASPATGTPKKNTKDGGAPNKLETSTPQPESSEMSGEKDSLPNTKLDPLKGADAAKSSKADSQVNSPEKSMNPTTSLSNPNEKQGGEVEKKGKGNDKPTGPPKDSEPKSFDPKTK